MFPPFIIFVIILTIQNFCIADDSKVSLLDKNSCANKVTCGECISTNNCAWCMKPNFDNSLRCFDPRIPLRQACPEEFIWNPETQQQIHKRRPLNSHIRGGDEGGYSTDIVQLTPQKIAFNLRINQIHNLEMSFQQADFPVDLYYLIDLSRFMESKIDRLRKLEALLSTNIQNITSNFRVGFGTFGAKMSKNDDDSDSFHNVMSLTRDLSGFSAKVKLTIDSARLGTPKSPIDAVMQVTACTQEIGWRDQARRILIIATNAEVPTTDEIFNDTKKSNDGLCHLDSNGYYTHSQVQNYPSVSQISSKVGQNKIITIFAVPGRQYVDYTLFKNYIEGSSTNLLLDDSLNILESVKMHYNMISSTVEMKDDAMRDVKLTYYSACLGETRVATNKCSGLRPGDVVNFTVEFLIPSCPTKSTEWFDDIEIYPLGFDESLDVDLTMICDCPCEKPEYLTYEPSSPKCSRSGTYKCGVCECDETHFGRNCECSAIDTLTEAGNDFGCRPDNITEIDCNGRGSCICGVCECEKRTNTEEIFSGKFCECDNFSCDRHNQILCSGPEHGTCQCGNCVCQPGWTGSACDCKATNDTCMPANGGEICSGHGECVCGECRCETTNDNRYSGEYCQVYSVR